MSFPTSPTNGQQATVNGIVYNYNSTKGAWVKVVTTASTLSFDSLVGTGNISINGNAAIGNALNTGGAITSGGFLTVQGSRIYQTNAGGSPYEIGPGSGTGVSTVWGFYAPENRSIAMFAGATERIRLNSAGNVIITPTTTSTSTTTGALVVAGGVGIAGNVVVGDSVINTPSGGIGSVSSRFTVNTAVKADFHISTAINGSSATATQQYGITLAIPGGATQAAILISENGADGTAVGFATTNNYASGPVIRTIIDPTGHLIPAANAAYDLGSTTLRWRNIYTNDLNLSNGRGDYTIVEGEEDLFIYNNRTGKTYKFLMQEVDPDTVPPKAQQD